MISQGAVKRIVGCVHKIAAVSAMGVDIDKACTYIIAADIVPSRNIKMSDIRDNTAAYYNIQRLAYRIAADNAAVFEYIIHVPLPLFRR